MTTYLTERAAWVLVAERVAAGAQAYDGGILLGLCGHAHDLGDRGVVSTNTRYAMIIRIRDNIRDDPTEWDGVTVRLHPASGSGWGFRYWDRDVRVLAALNLSVQAAQEGK